MKGNLQFAHDRTFIKKKFAINVDVCVCFSTYLTTLQLKFQGETFISEFARL